MLRHKGAEGIRTSKDHTKFDDQALSIYLGVFHGSLSTITSKRNSTDAALTAEGFQILPARQQQTSESRMGIDL